MTLATIQRNIVTIEQNMATREQTTGIAINVQNFTADD